jgi:formylglycine-generating enzyme required for sulfatase activity
VTGVTWQDAVDYCEWLSKKIGATVRLPSEKEWVLAAAGPQNFKYPWGNEWNPRAANYKGSRGGVIVAVKSYPDFKSPCGAYDMAGNVWEWVSDDALDGNGKQFMSGSVVHKTLKGGSAGVRPEYLTTGARIHLAPGERDPWVGFRYVVMRGNAAQ